MRALLVHLGLSALVAAGAAALVFVGWYPWPFREISGGRELFLIVVAVDVVLGPLVTFSVFDRRKPRTELVRDLVVVGMVQLAGLLYGLHTVFEARPVVMAVEVDRLRVVRAIDLSEDDLAKAPPEWRNPPLWGIQLIATRQARREEEMEAIQLGLQGVDLGMRPEFWLPATETTAKLLAGAKPLAELRQRYPDGGHEIDRAVAESRLGIDQIVYLPVMARRTDWVALFDRRSGASVGYAHVDGY